MKFRPYREKKKKKDARRRDELGVRRAGNLCARGVVRLTFNSEKRSGATRFHSRFVSPTRVIFQRGQYFRDGETEFAGPLIAVVNVKANHTSLSSRECASRTRAKIDFGTINPVGSLARDFISVGKIHGDRKNG